MNGQQCYSSYMEIALVYKTAEKGKFMDINKFLIFIFSLINTKDAALTIEGKLILYTLFCCAVSCAF